MKELALHIMDVMQNSITAGSSVISVSISTCDNNSLLEIIVEDDGCGMDEETLKNATDPFHTSRTTRMVGLGLPMFKAAAIMTGGDFALESKEGKGTSLKAVFVNDSLDRQPLGNLGNVFFLTMLSYETLELRLKLSAGKESFTFNSVEFTYDCKENGKSSMDAAFEAEAYINEQINIIFKDILPEVGGELHEVKRSSKAYQR